MGKRGTVAMNGKRTAGKSISVSAVSLAPTTGMSRDAKKVWKQVVGAFPIGHFTETDRILLEQFCEAAALHRSATAMLAETRYYKDAKGIVRRHPAADDQRQARCDCAMLATKLRITKQAMVSPKVAGRAALDAAEHSAIAGGGFGDLLFCDDGRRQ